MNPKLKINIAMNCYSCNGGVYIGVLSENITLTNIKREPFIYIYIYKDDIVLQLNNNSHKK